MPAAAKRPRGRPRLTPAPPGRGRAPRVRKDGAAYKPPTRITAEQLAAWLEANHQRYWSGRGRPPLGTIPLVVAAAEHFAVSRRTVARLVAVIAQRRARAARALPLDAAAAGLLAALSERYQRIPASMAAAPRARAPSGQARPAGAAGPAATAVVRALQASGPRELDDGILRYLTEHGDHAFLERVAALIALRRQAGARPAAPGAGGQPGARGLEAIGLQARARPAPGPAAAPPVGAPGGDPIRDALLEALEAYAALGDDAVLRAGADALARQLAVRPPPRR
jgi:hypothetical protein